MHLSRNSNAQIIRHGKDWYSVNAGGNELGEIERAYGPFPACRFVGYVAYKPGVGMENFGPHELYKAARFVEVGA